MRAWRFASSSDSGASPDTDQADVGELRLLETAVAEPPLAADGVLVQVHAGVLGRPEQVAHGQFTPGGAAVGTVVRAGDEATHLLDQRVVLGPEQACGECDICRRGEPVLCTQGSHLGRTVDGALATLVAARARWLCALAGDLTCEALQSPAAALVGREAAWAYAMFARAGVAPGEPVFVVGDDVVARLLVEVAIAKGVQPMAVYPAESTGYRDWLATTTAVAVPCAADGDVRAAAEAAARAGGHGRRPWFVFETSASAAGRRRATALSVPGGKIVLLATRALGRTSASDASDAFNIDVVADMDGTLVGVTGAHADLFPEVAALVVRGELDIVGAARLAAIDDLPARLAPNPAAAPTAWVVTVPQTGES